MKARFYSVNIFPKYTWYIPEISMGRVYSWYIPGIYQEKFIWGFHMPNIGFLPDIGSPTAPISGHVSLSFDPISGHVACDPISGTYIGYTPDIGHHVTDIVNHIPDIGINIGYNIGCPNTRYR
jgi:hypothetical protein